MLNYFLPIIIISVTSLYEFRVYSFEENETVSILTKNGEVVGKYVKVSSNWDEFYVQTFEGIPYAEPPIGDLRFKPPIPKKPWIGKILALKPYKYCMQCVDTLKRNFNATYSDLSEDCLYLTVWVPTPVRKNIPVMFFIYGSAFSEGPSITMNFERLVALENVIVVLTNYRLHSLGFFYLDHEECPGNMGFMDQELALRWTRDNIERFGGNPELITIFGHSSGSTSTEFILRNPNLRYLFKRASLHSGFLMKNQWIFGKKENMKKSLTVARKVGCGNELNNTRLIVKCLRGVDSRVLVEASASLIQGYPNTYHYPVLDDNIWRENLKPWQNMQDKEVILGILANEGGWLVEFSLRLGKMNPKDLFEYYVNKFLGDVGVETMQSIRYYYKDYCDEITEFKEEILSSHFLTDILYRCLAGELADDLAKAGVKTYFYHWTHKPYKTIFPRYLNATHMEELSFLFGYYDYMIGTPEIDLSRRYMAYLGSFAKYGDPNYENRRTKTIEPWPVYTFERKERLDIDLNYSSQAFGALQEDQCRFWKQDFPLLSKRRSTSSYQN